MAGHDRSFRAYAQFVSTLAFGFSRYALAFVFCILLLACLNSSTISGSSRIDSLLMLNGSPSGSSDGAPVDLLDKILSGPDNGDSSSSTLEDYPVVQISYEAQNLTGENSQVTILNSYWEGAGAQIFFSTNLGLFGNAQNPNQASKDKLAQVKAGTIQELGSDMEYSLSTSEEVQFVAFIAGINEEGEIFVTPFFMMEFVDSISNNKVLVPGQGFTGPTPEPPPKPGSNARVITRWNVVPFQILKDQRFQIGVVAFHPEGVDYVDFSVEGNDDWLRVSEASYNVRTKVVEYWAEIDPTLFGTDGRKEVRARIVPKKGLSRVLSTHVRINHHGTLPRTEMFVSPSGSDQNGDGSKTNPYKTVGHAAVQLKNHPSQGGNANGGIISLLAGEHDISSWPTQYVPTGTWLTIRGAPGVAREDVHIVKAQKDFQTNPNKTRYMHFQRLTLRDMVSNKTDGDKYIWFDNLDMYYEGMDQEGPSSQPMSWAYQAFKRSYATDVYIHDAEMGLTLSDIIRNTRMENLSHDVLGGSRLVVNVSIHNVSAIPLINANSHLSGSDVHSDLIEVTGQSVWQNVLYYNVLATEIDAQCFFMKNIYTILKDVAVVNFGCKAIGTNSKIDDVNRVENFYMAHSSFSQSFLFRDIDEDSTDIKFFGSVLPSISLQPNNPGVEIDTSGSDYNHFTASQSSFDSSGFGSHISFGNPKWDENLKPYPDSPLLVENHPYGGVPKTIEASYETWTSGILRGDPTNAGMY